MFTKRNEKGFTLMEMLIVVAIIAILVAVSIPVFTSQLEKAREATDAANERAAKAVAVTSYLADATTGTFFYDAASGTLKAAKTDIVAYGKGTATAPDTNAHTNQIIQAVIGADGSVTISWTGLT